MSASTPLLHGGLLRSLLDVDRVAFQTHLAGLLRDHPPLEVLEAFITPILLEIGEGWVEGRYALSQMYMSGKFCEEVIPALLAGRNEPPRNDAPLAIAVLQDQHILGKKIVYHALRAAGYHVLDYGAVPSPKELVERALADKVRILLVSTLMLPSALSVKDVTRLLKEKGSAVKVIAGGAPFNFDTELWREVGADATRASAAEAIPLVASLLKEAVHG